MKVDIFNTDKKYNIIYADPPWQYRSKECLAKKSILNGELNVHYPTMTLDEIKQLPIPKIAEKDSLLFLWVVSPMLDDCMEVLKSWGYRYATIGFVWDKQKPNPGSYTMSQCEVCLIGKKGKIPTPRGIRNARQFLSEKKKNIAESLTKSETGLWQCFLTILKLSYLQGKLQKVGIVGAMKHLKA